MIVYRRFESARPFAQDELMEATGANDNAATSPERGVHEKLDNDNREISVGSHDRKPHHGQPKLQ
jgi:hypothetical protein